MPVITYTTACISKRLIARDVYEFTLKKPSGFTFKPGQFVLFDVALIENPADVQTRAFSIASAPHEKDLVFVAKMVPGGRASRWIVEAMGDDAVVTMKGPFGNFVLDTQTSNDYLFIATSTGVAPFRAMVLHALSPGPSPAAPSFAKATEGRAREGSPRMEIIFGAKSEEDLFWIEEMEAIMKQFPSVYLHFALSDPSPQWKGHKGRVQTLIPQIITDFSNKSVYVCGNPDMTKEVKNLALTSWGVEKKNLHVEGYI